MRLDDTIKLSTRMFKTNPARTWLTILGMGVGTSAVVLLVGLGFGLQGILLEQIVFGDTLLSLNVTNPASRAVTMDDARLKEFLEIEHVEDVSPLASFSALITFNNLTGNITLQGVNPSYFRYTGVIAEEGDIMKRGEEEADRGKALLSKAALKLFGIDDAASAIGKPVKFYTIRNEVVNSIWHFVGKNSHQFMIIQIPTTFYCILIMLFWSCRRFYSYI